MFPMELACFKIDAVGRTDFANALLRWLSCSLSTPEISLMNMHQEAIVSELVKRLDWIFDTLGQVDHNLILCLLDIRFPFKTSR